MDVSNPSYLWHSQHWLWLTHPVKYIAGGCDTTPVKPASLCRIIAVSYEKHDLKNASVPTFSKAVKSSDM